MTINDGNNKKEQEQTADAWARLEKQLLASEQSPLWEKWEKQAQQNADLKEQGTPAATGAVHVPVQASGLIQAQEQMNAVPVGRTRNRSSEGANKQGKNGAARRWFKRNAGKTIAACAAALITVVIATPATNEALAAWLNTFRMDKVMVVQENDLASLMNSFLNEGETLEMSNRFGDFEQTSHSNWEKLAPDKAAKQLGFAIPAVKVADEQLVDISSTSSQTFKFSLKVDEINDAMRKLGADKLLPSSVDGKEIIFNTGRGIQISYSPKDEASSQQRAWINYLEAPTIKVDPSVDVKDAFEAVTRFPALPDHLRNSLMQASSLEDGKIPMPLFTSGETKKISLKGIDVYVEHRDGSYSTATWLEKGYIVTAGFENYGDAQKVESAIAELVHS
ncbi:hypothetical protein [Bacillus sp. FJAT-26390]|uniref:hypothetical protein n=1 Tax=Bacillus sp. FJAT-26390 TaxID=1743142 RepID=UPI000807EE9D|nr:hypothetical protein [Bacillus sp. FJAT-26390]OBZ08569.1 hypothetical protein A7975_26145 [Bacillus sp. FJAT-26390]